MRTDAAPTTELGTQQLLGAAERGAGYLAQNLLPTGRFVHQRDARTGLPVSGPYDAVRHFGALWALLDVRGYDPAMQAAAAQGMRWAIDKYHLPTPAGSGFKVNDWLLTACGGLALLVLDELATPYGQDVAELAPGIVDFLLAQRIADGPLRHDFHHRIALRPFAVDLSRGEVSVNHEFEAVRNGSASGQVLLGLITHLATATDSFEQGDAGFDHHRFVLLYEAVTNAMDRLLARNYGVRQRSPWAVYAIRRYAELTDRLLGMTGHGDAEVAAECRRSLLGWAGRIAAAVLATAQRETDDRSAPTGRRVEALTQFLELADSHPAGSAARQEWDQLTESALRQIERDCAVLLDLQDDSGGFPGSAQDPVMRIGHTQHAISALLGAAYLIGN